MIYHAPVEDMIAAMRDVGGLDGKLGQPGYEDLSLDLVRSILEEAGRFSGDVLAPLNRLGDQVGARLVDGHMVMPPGWTEAYHAWAQAGWGSLAAPAEFGGQGLPALVNAACTEMWNAACMSFALGPLLTNGAIEALTAHGSAHLQEVYLPKLVSGEWMGTMNLTEPQAGSDLAALRTRAERAGDGTYRITGQKIYITYGEHDITPNIVHLVLARLPDAPHGTRGISLFLVPKFLVNLDGSPGARNDVRCASIEHKMGIHASPTCTMVFGDEGGAVGYLIGEENRGLACMFTMMNNARLGVGLQGVAIAERAYQKALAFAKERRQGRAPGYTGQGMSAIIDHADIQRMLMTMKTQTQASRALCYMTAAAIDDSHRAADPAARKAAAERAALLTPVAKSYATDIGIEVASLGIQVHGGMGFVEETGAAQHLRDARIAAIYEGTNGIQAIDLVTRKLPLSGGEAVGAEIALMRRTLARLTASREPAFGASAARLRDAVDALDRATSHMLRTLRGNRPEEALPGAAPYLTLFGLARGGTALADMALASAQGENPAHGHTRPAGAAALCRYFAQTLAPGAGALELAVMTAADSLDGARETLLQ
jgi:butyryl-CoA dehydrogenase